MPALQKKMVLPVPESSRTDASSAVHSSSSSPEMTSISAAKTFNFITITDPAQAKDKKNKRNVRSHVMFDYAANRKRDQRKLPGHRSDERRSIRRISRTSVASKQNTHVDDDTDDFDFTKPTNEESVAGLDAIQDMARSLIPRPGSNTQVSARPAAPDMQELSRYYRALAKLTRHEANSSGSQPLLLQNDEIFELVWKAGFVKPYSLRGLGGEVDPFFVLPQFKHPMIYMARLKMWCTRRFGTKAMSIHWVPALAKSRLTYLASLCVGATDMDVASGLKCDSALTVAVKTEVIELVNEQLADPTLQYSDETVMAVPLLLAGEIASGHEWIWDVHEKGLTQILVHRGGLQTLGVHGQLAVTVFSIVAFVNILRCTPLHDVYKRYVPIKMRTMSSQRAVLESPIYCPRSDFFTIVRSKLCTEALYDLLCDLRDLTDLFLEQHRVSEGHEADTSDTFTADSCLGSPEGIETEMQSHGVRQVKARAILDKVTQLPPFDPNVDAPSCSAWRFEACRIAAVIYATALVELVNFSEAAFLADLATTNRAYANEGTLPACVHALRDAILNSNVAECWSDLASILHWASLIGSCAAYNGFSGTDFTDDEEWSRKVLSSTAMRVSIVLLFEHGDATMRTLRRLNYVQEILAQPRMRRLY